MISLILSILVLFVGPVIYKNVSNDERLLQLIDGFIFISIGALVLRHVLPEASGDDGFIVLGFLLLGFLGPNIIESRLKDGHNVHVGVLILGVFGLALHGILDGAALVATDIHFDHHHDSDSISSGQSNTLAAAIILHRLPVGLTLWFLVRPHFGKAYAFLAIISLSLMTVIGFVGVEALAHTFTNIHWIEWVQSAAAGAILHVVVFPFHLEDSHLEDEHSKAEHSHGSCCGSDNSKKYFSISNLKVPAEGLGNLLGLIVVGFILLGNVDFHSDHEHTSELTENFVSLFATSAPALLLAYVAGGLIFAFAPASSIGWLAKGGNLKQMLKGLAVGLPLPVCSCGVLPLYETLSKRGVPAAAAFTFLLATPELGIDAIFISIPFLGYEMTMVRIVSVILFTILVVAGLLYFGDTKTKIEIEDAETENKTLSEKFKQGAYFGSISLVENTGAWILLGILIAALMTPLLNEGFFDFSPTLQVLAFSVVGAVVYVCAAGSTPFVAILLSSGLSPGAAVSFLLTGPATNISTFGVISQIHGKKTAILFSILAASCSVALGLFVNFTFGSSITIQSIKELEHSHLGSLEIICMYALCFLFIFSVLRAGARSFFGQVVGKLVHAHH